MTAPAPAPRNAIAIEALRDPARFLDAQRAFYRHDPNYVPPLTLGEKWTVDPRQNPFFEHATVEFFVSREHGRITGRISVCRDRLHDEFHGNRVGFFGHFEAEDERTARALLDHAAQWLREHGAESMRGPINLSTNYMCGLLVEGEPGPPVLMMPHNPTSYRTWFEAWGLEKAKDLLALWVDGRDIDLPRLDRIATHIRRKLGATMRSVDLKNWDREVQMMWNLYNRIWERNWGFVPMSKGEFLRQAKDLKSLAHPALMHVAEVAGEPVGFVVGLPDANLAIRKARGRLLPFGWFHLLRAHRTHRIRVITLGSLPEHRGNGLPTLLLHEVIFRGIANGFTACEASWILEDNRDMLGPLEKLGHKCYRRYRIFEKKLH